MRRRPWRAGLLLVGGGLAGIAVAGIPTRRTDPPIRLDAAESTSSSITLLPILTTTSTSTTTTTTPSSTSTTRKRP
jgi:hypothetical protein